MATARQKFLFYVYSIREARLETPDDVACNIAWMLEGSYCIGDKVDCRVGDGWTLGTIVEIAEAKNMVKVCLEELDSDVEAEVESYATADDDESERVERSKHCIWVPMGSGNLAPVMSHSNGRTGETVFECFSNPLYTPSEFKIQHLVEVGFDEVDASTALAVTNNDLNAAVDFIFDMDLSRETFSCVSVGDLVDIKNGSSWFPAKLLEKNSRHIKVHYLHFDSSFDQIIRNWTGRMAPISSKTSYDPSRREISLRSSKLFGDSSIETLVDLGFSPQDARHALLASAGCVDYAIQLLLTWNAEQDS
jgi:hypothetical protein